MSDDDKKNDVAVQSISQTIDAAILASLGSVPKNEKPDLQKLEKHMEKILLAELNGAADDEVYLSVSQQMGLTDLMEFAMQDAELPQQEEMSLDFITRPIHPNQVLQLALQSFIENEEEGAIEDNFTLSSFFFDRWYELQDRMHHYTMVMKIEDYSEFLPQDEVVYNRLMAINRYVDHYDSDDEPNWSGIKRVLEGVYDDDIRDRKVPYPLRLKRDL